VENQQLIFLLSNPFTFGALLSWFCEQIAWFKDPKNSNWSKLSIVIAACFTWALLLFSLDKNALPSTAADWKIVLINTLAVVASSQITNVLLPGLIDLLKSLKAAPVIVTATTANTSTYTNGSMTTTTSATAELPPGQKIEDNTRSLPVPNVKLPVPKADTQSEAAELAQG
jgi:hypothetical protein